VRESAVDAAVEKLSEQWVIPLAVIALCVGIGISALVAFDKAARQEYELLDRQRAFGTRVTHELKTPLAGIKVMAENIEAGHFRDDEHRRDMARRIVQETDQLTRRVDEVLAVAKQRSIPSPQPVDPEEILLIAIDEWGPRLQDAGVVLKAELAATDPILGDGNALKDAVACLLDNALKYRKEGREDNQVWLDLHQQGKSILVTITDNGIGVPRLMRKRIFDRFTRVEGPNRGSAGGHGLGLAQVKEIVTAHHGTVTCGDGVDGGAQFVIRLPALRSDEA
jgi:signal transduction histidine kinase